MASPEYKLLEPDSLSSLGIASPSFDGASVSFLSITTFLWMLAFSFIIGAAFYRLLLAGGIRMRASEADQRKSNEMIKRVTLGLFGVFSLFLLLFTVNRGLLTGDVSLEGLSVRGTTMTQNIPATIPSSGNKAYADRVKSHNAVVARLAPSGIHTNRGDAPCTEAQFSEKKPACTSLAYLPEETIQLLLSINSACKCTLVITGGTEPGHQTHGEGRRAVDLRLGGPRGDPNNPDPLYVFIRGVAINRLGPSNTFYERFLWKTFTFGDEKPPSDQHFHVY